MFLSVQQAIFMYFFAFQYFFKHGKMETQDEP